MSAFPSVVNRSVIVTGASRGLGRAMALGLLAAGAAAAERTATLSLRNG